MAIQFDGNGTVTFPEFLATGDFSLTVEFIYEDSLALVVGHSTDSKTYVGCVGGGTARARLAGDTLDFTGLTAGDLCQFTLTRVGIDYTATMNGISQSRTSAGDIKLDTFGSYLVDTYPSSTIMSGLVTMSEGGPILRSYDTDQPQTSTILPDTVSSQDGTLSGFTTGGFLGVVNAIAITSISDYQCRKCDSSYQADFVVSGTIGGTATSVEYQLDDGVWQTLDPSPSSVFSGTVRVTKQQDIKVRLSNETTVQDSVTKVTAALCIGIGPAQSNAAGPANNNQPITVLTGKPTPVMYKQGVFSALQDPTSIQDVNGSMWPLIAQEYSNLGIPVCFANVAKGGTAIGSWQSGGQNFQEVKNFAEDVGGLNFAITLIGESDSAQGTTKEQFKTSYLEPVGYINTNYSCDVYAVYFPVGENTGTTSNVNAIRTAYDELIAENEYIKFGGDLSVIDVSAASGADGLHMRTDSQITEGASIVYAALNGMLSDLTITATGIPDGIYNTVLVNSSNEIVHAGNVTYSSGQALLENLALTSGTPLTGFVVDNEISHSDGAVITGTTV